MANKSITGVLPDELLLYILSFVPERDLTRNTSLVSKTWHHFSRDSALWKSKCVNRWGEHKLYNLFNLPVDPPQIRPSQWQKFYLYQSSMEDFTINHPDHTQKLCCISTEDLILVDPNDSSKDPIQLTGDGRDFTDRLVLWSPFGHKIYWLGTKGEETLLRSLDLRTNKFSAQSLGCYFPFYGFISPCGQRIVALGQDIYPSSGKIKVAVIPIEENPFSQSKLSPPSKSDSNSNPNSKSNVKQPDLTKLPSSFWSRLLSPILSSSLYGSPDYQTGQLIDEAAPFFYSFNTLDSRFLAHYGDQYMAQYSLLPTHDNKYTVSKIKVKLVIKNDDPNQLARPHKISYSGFSAPQWTLDGQYWIFMIQDDGQDKIILCKPGSKSEPKSETISQEQSNNTVDNKEDNNNNSAMKQDGDDEDDSNNDDEEDDDDDNIIEKELLSQQKKKEKIEEEIMEVSVERELYVYPKRDDNAARSRHRGRQFIVSPNSQFIALILDSSLILVPIHSTTSESNSLNPTQAKNVSKDTEHEEGEDGMIPAFFFSPNSRYLIWMVVVRGRLCYNCWDVVIGEGWRFENRFSPSSVVARSFLPFFEQYYQSDRGFDEKSEKFVYCGTQGEPDLKVFVQELKKGGKLEVLGNSFHHAVYSPV